jgi:DNA-directed RNA polymerase specialized sigma24 family protein
MLDSETYTAAFQKSLKSTIRFLSMRGANEDKATDLAMDAWTKAWEKRALYDASKGAVITWVTRIAWRLMQKDRHKNIHMDLVGLDLPAAEGPNGEPPTTGVRKELWVMPDFAAMHSAIILSRCSPATRQLLTNYYIDGSTAGIPGGRKLARRGRTQVRKMLKVAAANRGNHSPAKIEQIARLAVLNRGRIHSPEARARMAASHYGQKSSPESYARMAAAQQLRRLRDRAAPDKSTISLCIKHPRTGKDSLDLE